MAMDEPKESDATYDIDGFQYIIDNDLQKQAAPVKVDFTGTGFKIESAMKFEKSSTSCSGCGTTSECC
jgi:Fe-S cluster assembly iron-binding protein IscA